MVHIAQQFDLLVSSVEDYAIFLVGIDGCVASWNAGAERIKGYAAPEILGKPIQIFYTEPDKADHRPQQLLKAAAERGSIEEEGWRVRKDGTQFWAHISITGLRDEQGRLLGFAKITADQSKRRQIEEELRLSEEQFSTAFEYAAIGMALIRTDGRFIRVNHSLAEMLGYSRAELLGVDSRSVAHPEDVDHEVADARQLLDGASSSYRMDKRYIRKDGEMIWVTLNVSLVRDVSGEPKHFIAQMQDITDRRRAELDLELSRAQSLSNARLSALGLMAGSVAHEINNPLCIIHGAATNLVDLAEQESPSREVLLKNSTRVLYTAERIAKIVNSMRQVAREGGSDAFSEVQLRTIIEETLPLCSEQFRTHSVTLSVLPFDPTLLIRCRQVQVEQLLLNLLQNAFDAVTENEDDRWVRLEIETTRECVTLFVVDNGCGIPPAARERIMEPFYTTKAVGKGTGLGLSISKVIAEEHGGRLEVGERDGHTAVSLTLSALKEQYLCN
jgi:PAS domain S-box-containing protein